MKPCREPNLCRQCANLLAECGPDHFALYRKKLLITGWAGQYSDVERAYRRKHRSEAQSAAIEASSARLASLGKRFGAVTTREAGETGKS